MSLRIITPTLGESPWLPEALAAASDYERIVAIPAECEAQVANIRPEIKVVVQSRPGLYAALNEGLRYPGDWTAATCFNDDDRLIEDGLRSAIALLESTPRIAAVFGKVVLIDRHGRRLAAIPVSHTGSDLGPLFARGIIPLAQPGTVFSRSVFEALGGFDEELKAAGDMDFFLRALAAGFNFVFIDKLVAEFRVHRGQISKQLETRSNETAALVAKAQEVPGWLEKSRAARWRFWSQNCWAYCERILRHGFVSMETLYTRE